MGNGFRTSISDCNFLHWMYNCLHLCKYNKWKYYHKIYFHATLKSFVSDKLDVFVRAGDTAQQFQWGGRDSASVWHDQESLSHVLCILGQAWELLQRVRPTCDLTRQFEIGSCLRVSLGNTARARCLTRQGIGLSVQPKGYGSGCLSTLVWSYTIQLRLNNPVSLFCIGLPCKSVCKLTALCQFVMELNGYSSN